MLEMNQNLNHLNFNHTNMFESALKAILERLHKSINLRCFHLCGNLDIDDKLKEWIRREIEGRVIEHSEEEA